MKKKNNNHVHIHIKNTPKKPHHLVSFFIFKLSQYIIKTFLYCFNYLNGYIVLIHCLVFMNYSLFDIQSNYCLCSVGVNHSFLLFFLPSSFISSHVLLAQKLIGVSHL